MRCEMKDPRPNMESVRTDIINLFQEHDLSVPEVMTTLSILMAQLAVVEEVPKENILLGMSTTYDITLKQMRGDKQCH